LSGQTILLTPALGQLVISTNMTIDALAVANVSVSGGNATRVFKVSSLVAVVVMAGFRITGGNGSGENEGGFQNIGNGGGIQNIGNLTLNSMVIEANTANNGTLGGGGIFNSGGGTTTLMNSTVSGNRTAGVGGGILIENGTVNLTSVTVAFNSTAITRGAAGGGVYNNFGTANLSNTIVAKNTSGFAPDFGGRILSGSFNLIGDGTGMNGITGGTNGNQVGVDPKLDPTLALNGGTTLNHALFTDSPAIDKGNATGTDQRGLTRPVDNLAIANAIGGNGADIGAFEVQVTTAATVSVSGRVTARGRGISNAVVHLTSQGGEILTARTNRLGYYTFTELAAGETYIFNVFSKRYQFNPQVINLTEDLDELNFTAQ
jgi:hypothetical protein